VRLEELSPEQRRSAEQILARAVRVVVRLAASDRQAFIDRAPAAYKGPDGDLELGRLVLPIARLDADDHVLGLVLRNLLPVLRERPFTAERWVELGRWTECGRPRIHVAGEQAAALMLSDLSDEQLDALGAPWPAFRIMLAEPLAVGEDAARVGHVDVHRFKATLPHAVDDGKWLLSSEWGARTASAGGASAKLVYHQLPFAESLPAALRDPREVELRPEEARVMTLLSRLVLNLCFALRAEPSGEPVAVLGPRTRRRKGEKRRRVVSIASTQDFELRWSPGVDVRAHVSDYLSGAAKRVYKVRWIVRGHWRSQPHGPERSLRRLTWIAPHWKGPEIL
jgi:hypothetical protein